VRKKHALNRERFDEPTTRGVICPATERRRLFIYGIRITSRSGSREWAKRYKEAPFRRFDHQRPTIQKPFSDFSNSLLEKRKGLIERKCA
jgi:hypothetical protein